MNNSYDLKQRILNFRGRLVYLYFLASLSNDTLISRLVEGIENNQGKDLENCLNMGDVEIMNTNDIHKIQYALMCGNCALFDGETTYVMDTKNYPNRSIEEPETEKSVRGAKDGFNESKMCIRDRHKLLWELILCKQLRHLKKLKVMMDHH